MEKKLSILKKELLFNMGIGISNLILGIVSYLNFSKKMSLIILSLNIFVIFSTVIPFLAKSDEEDELSEKIRDMAGWITLKVGVIVIMILSIFFNI